MSDDEINNSDWVVNGFCIPYSIKLSIGPEVMLRSQEQLLKKLTASGWELQVIDDAISDWWLESSWRINLFIHLMASKFISFS